MERRSFLGGMFAVLGGLLVGRKAVAAPATDVLVPPHIVRWLEELDTSDVKKMFFSVEKVQGRKVWSRCYF